MDRELNRSRATLFIVKESKNQRSHDNLKGKRLIGLKGFSKSLKSNNKFSKISVYFRGRDFLLFIFKKQFSQLKIAA